MVVMDETPPPPPPLRTPPNLTLFNTGSVHGKDTRCVFDVGGGKEQRGNLTAQHQFLDVGDIELYVK